MIAKVSKILASPPEVEPDHSNIWSAVARVFIEHPVFLNVQEKIESLLPLHGTAKSLPCIPFIGVTGIGKTTIYDKLKEKYPVQKNARQLLLSDGQTLVADHVPVLFARMPQKPSAVRLLKALLRGLGAPHYDKGAQTSLEERVDLYLPCCGTKLILLDEGNRLVDQTGEITAQEVVDCIKDRHEISGVSFAILSLPRIRHLFAQDRQINRRWNELTIAPYDWGDINDIDGPPSRTYFIALLTAFLLECPMQVAAEITVEDDRVVLRFYYVCSGVTGRLKDLLMAAMEIANESKGEIKVLDFELLSLAFQRAFKKEIRENMFRDPFVADWVPCLPPPLPDDDVTVSRKRSRQRKKDRDLVVRMALTKR